MNNLSIKKERKNLNIKIILINKIQKYQIEKLKNKIIKILKIKTNKF